MPRPVHLFILAHGLWGSVAHLQVMEDVLVEQFAGRGLPAGTTSDQPGASSVGEGSSSTPKDEHPVEVRVLRIKGNEDDKTYDGIDINASRVVEELDAEIERIEAEGLEVKYLSMAGYSLGGLVARYALGILYNRPTFFAKHTPVNFASFASPWLGSLKYNTLFNKLFTAVGSRFVSRTGEQLFCVDKEQLVSRLARKDEIFYKALALFKRIDVFASAQNDRTVPFPSGAFVADDPFENWETSGLEVETHDDSPIIKSYHLPSTPGSSASSLPSSSSSSSTALAEPKDGAARPSAPKPKPKPRKKHVLPPFLRFRFPLNLVFFLFLPLLMPVALSLILFRLGRESRRSRKRLRGGDSASLWERIRELEQALETELEDGLGLVGSADDNALLAVDGRKPSGLRLTDSQRGMIKSLDQLPGLNKWFAWFPDAFNSHAVIIGRDPVRFPDHGKGRQVIRFWTDRIVLQPAGKPSGLVDL